MKAAESVVVVKALDSQGVTKELGSGVALGHGEVATNRHVIKNASRTVIGHKSSFFEAMLLYRDDKRDLCMLIAPELDTFPAILAKPGDLKIGSAVYAIGAPQGLELSLSGGLVSQLHADKTGSVIQTTAAVSLGSSGGGLFDDAARLVGITSFCLRGGQNLNVALPVEWIAELRSSEFFARNPPHGSVAFNCSPQIGARPRRNPQPPLRQFPDRRPPRKRPRNLQTLNHSR